MRAKPLQGQLTPFIKIVKLESRGGNIKCYLQDGSLANSRARYSANYIYADIEKDSKCYLQDGTDPSGAGGGASKAVQQVVDESRTRNLTQLELIMTVNNCEK